MSADARRRRELQRLATEVLADVESLGLVAEQLATARVHLTPSSRPMCAMVAVDLHRYYTAVENLLERIERSVGALPPNGPSWHRDLLEGATHRLADARPAILSGHLLEDLEELLAFRRFFRHAYKVEFDATRLIALTDRVARSHKGTEADFRNFVSYLNGVADQLAP